MLREIAELTYGGVTMFARTSTWTGSPEALTKWADHVADQVAPMVRSLPGVAGAVFFLDRAGENAMTLTLWDTEEAALLSDQHAEASRASTVAATGVELTGRGRYEILARF
jgi:heme-degrading monooxygenase HmoA